MAAKNDDLIDDYVEDGDEDENALRADMPVSTKTPINLDARRRLEEYRDQQELARLLRDEFDYLDEIA
ncbi:MAG: hypothetical protein OEX19_01585 [Gammaproteobacteria bacterium]|nr:hypothetical protein [Gammaproteobacteria bacterium]